MTDQELLELLDHSWEIADWDGVAKAMKVLRERLEKIGLSGKTFEKA